MTHFNDSFQAASSGAGGGWDNSGDWGESIKDDSSITKSESKSNSNPKKQDSWGEFEDWLSEEKTGKKE